MDKNCKDYIKQKQPKLYDVKQIKDIFHLESLSSARRLMNHPAFPSLRIGRKLLVTEWELMTFLEANSEGYIDLY